MPRTTIRWRLFGLIAGVVCPFVAVTGLLACNYADAELRVIEARRFDEANNLSFLVDGEVKAIQSMLKILAAFPQLKNGDFEGFRPLAEAAVFVSGARGARRRFTMLSSSLPARYLRQCLG